MGRGSDRRETMLACLGGDCLAQPPEFLAGLTGKSWLVLGDMGELGDDAAAMHRDVGTAARDAGIDHLFATGDLSRNAVEAFGRGARWFADVDSLIDELAKSVDRDANVLVKGSRHMRMERVVEALSRSSEGEA